jgi:hypothetical protein
MSEFERSNRVGMIATGALARSEHGQSRGGRPGQSSSESADPHASWLKEWRSLRSEAGGHKRTDNAGAAIRELQNNIAHTPAWTLAGLQAQAELISELAWNDVVAATARQLLSGIKRLQKKS